MTGKATTKPHAQRRKAPSRKIEDKEQYERFRQFARDHGADESPEAFDREFQKLVHPKR